MNRDFLKLKLLVFIVTIAAVWSAQAHDGHPVSDNMCGSPGYGDCYNEALCGLRAGML